MSSVPADQRTEPVRPDRARLNEPAAWVHTVWMEFGQTDIILTHSRESPFGVPGRDYSACYPVTSEPLFRKEVIKKPRVRVR